MLRKLSDEEVRVKNLPKNKNGYAIEGDFHPHVGKIVDLDTQKGKTRKVTARKDYVCVMCGLAILKGEQYESRSACYDGTWYRSWVCPFCWSGQGTEKMENGEHEPR